MTPPPANHSRAVALATLLSVPATVRSLAATRQLEALQGNVPHQEPTEPALTPSQLRRRQRKMDAAQSQQRAIRRRIAAEHDKQLRAYAIALAEWRQAGSDPDTMPPRPVPPHTPG